MQNDLEGKSEAGGYPGTVKRAVQKTAQHNVEHTGGNPTISQDS